MALHVSLSDVQQWLEKTKLTLTEVDPEFEASATAIAFSILSSRYDTSTWTNETTTPEIVRVGLSMWIASYEYRRAYSESTAATANSYADWLEKRGSFIIEGLQNGLIDIPGVIETSSPTTPLYWPDDTTGDDGVSEAKFTIGRAF
jgi:hypothetical protein